MNDITSVKDFYTRFCPTEQKAREIIAEWRWNGKPACPFCESSKVYQRKDGRYICKCNKSFSVKTGTFMQSTHIPLQQWLYAMYIIKINTKGISSLQLSRELGITQKSAWYMAQKIRECFTDQVSLGGVVEMDETFIGGKEGNKHANKRLKQGRGTVGKTAVMGAISRDSKQVVAYPVKTVNTSTVGNFINRNIEKYSDVIADEAPSYDKYTALRINHGKGQYADGLVHTNSIESYWAVVKRGQMGVYHWWSKKHLSKYMREFTFRFNRREQSNVSFIHNVFCNGRNRVRTFKDIVR